MDTLGATYDLKEGSVGPPTIYLGAKIKKYQVKSGKSHWSMSSTHHVKNAVKTVEDLLKADGRSLRKAKSAVKQPHLRDKRHSNQCFAFKKMQNILF